MKQRYKELSHNVALRKESVDRNVLYLDNFHSAVWSLSARRAWIEISISCAGSFSTTVALRKESVDRNAGSGSTGVAAIKSLSARRAWIEMGWRLTACPMMCGSLSARRAWIEIEAPSSAPYAELRVALRKESVDRNSEDWFNAGSLSRSLSARRAWIEMM